MNTRNSGDADLLYNKLFVLATHAVLRTMQISAPTYV